MAIDVTPVLKTYLGRNRGPVPGDPEARQQPNYELSASLDGGVIILELTLCAGSPYCCYEHGCHLPLYENKRWDRLRSDFTAHGLSVPDRLELHLTVNVEAGALFFEWSRPMPLPRGRGWYAFTPADAQQNHHVVIEASDSELTQSLD